MYTFTCSLLYNIHCTFYIHHTLTCTHTLLYTHIVLFKGAVLQRQRHCTRIFTNTLFYTYIALTHTDMHSHLHMHSVTHTLSSAKVLCCGGTNVQEALNKVTTTTPSQLKIVEQTLPGVCTRALVALVLTQCLQLPTISFVTLRWSYSHFLARYCPHFARHLNLPRALCEVAVSSLSRVGVFLTHVRVPSLSRPEPLTPNSLSNPQSLSLSNSLSLSRSLSFCLSLSHAHTLPLLPPHPPTLIHPTPSLSTFTSISASAPL